MNCYINQQNGNDYVVHNTKSEISMINNSKKNNVINNGAPQTPSGSTGNASKLLTFIKTKPLFFSLIIVGVTAVVATAIVVPIVINNKQKNDSENQDIVPNNENSNNNGNNNGNNNDNNYNSHFQNDELLKFDDSINIDNTRNFDFDSIKSEIETLYNGIGTNDDSTLETFCNYLKGTSFTQLTDIKKVYFAYNWVAKNILYDYAGYKNGNTNCVPESFFNSRTTVCSGYSRLFRDLLKCMSYSEDNIKNIQGHSKGLGFDVNKELSDNDVDHEWNSVKIGDNWCLIDTTWGAGSIVNEAFHQLYSEYYLCTPPQQFVRSHLPKQVESNYQYLADPIDISAFKNMAKTSNEFFEYGFIGLSNDKSIQNTCGEGKIFLKYNTAPPSRLYLLVRIEKDTNEINNVKDNWNMEKRIPNGFEINFSINEAGNYNLRVSANNNGGDSYNGIVSFLIKCDCTPVQKKYYPKLTKYYDIDDNNKLISPMDNNLIQGQNYNFEIESSYYDQLYLLLGINGGNKEIIVMDKQGTKFTEDNVMIHGEYVKISYKNSGDQKYYPLVEYSTTGEMIQFPETSETSIKKKLESPLTHELKVNQTYNFKIICDGTSSIMFLYNGGLHEEFDKNGNVFTAQLLITNSISSTLTIMYNTGGGSYESMYSFQVIP